MLKIKKNGLTLLEVLVAVAIIAILSAGLFAVGNYLDTKAKIDRTKSTIHLLAAALEQYHDFFGRFPIVDTNDPNGYPAANCDSPPEKLYYRLSLVPESKKILSQIQASNREKHGKHNPIRDTDKDGFPEICDGWGLEFLYKYKSGDNFPEIISEGPKEGAAYKEDDISSKDL